MPGARADATDPAVAALQDPPLVASSFTTTDVGRAGVKVLLIRSRFTPRLTSAFGVTLQEQQDTSCSSGENAYTFTQMLPPVAPVLVMLITDSPAARLAAYLTWNGASAVIGF